MSLTIGYKWVDEKALLHIGRLNDDKEIVVIYNIIIYSVNYYSVDITDEVYCRMNKLLQQGTSTVQYGTVQHHLH